jgi:DNA polymerase III delta prime subunit
VQVHLLLFSNCTIFQVEVLKQAVMMKRDKLIGECEKSQVTEELAVRTKEMERLTEQLQSCDKEWQARLNAETNKWQARLEEHQQDVEAEQAKMAEAVAGMCSSFLEREIKQVPVYRVICCYTSLANSNIC